MNISSTGNLIYPGFNISLMSYLDHCGIFVKDMEKSLLFYKDFFGCKEKTHFSSGEAKITVLDIGKGLLELVQRPGSPESPPGGNWSHLAFHVDDWDIKVKKLVEKGIELRKITRDDGSRIAFFKDPDGHTLEIMEKGLSLE